MREVCPICHREEPDMRHVAVECCYAVDEVVPSIEEKQIFSEVDEGKTYFAVTRRYPVGTRDEHYVKSREVIDGITHTKWETRQLPIGPIRLMEITAFSQTCCKSCRADFLTLFGRWAKGEFVTPEPEEDTGIYVRVNGTTRSVTLEEYYRMKERR